MDSDRHPRPIANTEIQTAQPIGRKAPDVAVPPHRVTIRRLCRALNSTKLSSDGQTPGPLLDSSDVGSILIRNIRVGREGLLGFWCLGHVSIAAPLLRFPVKKRGITEMEILRCFHKGTFKLIIASLIRYGAKPARPKARHVALRQHREVRQACRTDSAQVHPRNRSPSPTWCRDRRRPRSADVGMFRARPSPDHHYNCHPPKGLRRDSLTRLACDRHFLIRRSPRANFWRKGCALWRLRGCLYGLFVDPFYLFQTHRRGSGFAPRAANRLIGKLFNTHCQGFSRCVEWREATGQRCPVAYIHGPSKKWGAFMPKLVKTPKGFINPDHVAYVERTDKGWLIIHFSIPEASVPTGISYPQGSAPPAATGHFILSVQDNADEEIWKQFAHLGVTKKDITD